MAMTPPKLDPRNFADLMREARNRIPRYTPEWTNFNPSDPGMTLVELHAWMTEAILYELNRVPEKNYNSFLALLGIQPNPARPACAELSFTLDNLDLPSNPLVVPIPMGSQVGVEDPEIKTNILFETDRSLLALNAAIACVITPVAGQPFSHGLVANYDNEKGTVWLHSFPPFLQEPKPDLCLYLGLLLRPNMKLKPDAYVADALPAGPLDLYLDVVEVYDKAPDGSSVNGPLTVSSGQDLSSRAVLQWQIWTGLNTSVSFEDTENRGWTNLATSVDETNGLTVSGHLVLEIPAQATPLSPRQINSKCWADCGLTKPPVSFDELKEVISQLDILEPLADYWERMGWTDPDDQEAIAACGNNKFNVIGRLDHAQVKPNPANISADDWAKIDPAFQTALPIAEGEFRPLYWIRARLIQPPASGGPPIAPLRSLRLNTVAATQAVTRLEDRIGVSNGRPGQSARVPKVPVLIDPAAGKPDLTLFIVREDDWEPWERVEDFYQSKPDSPHYLLNASSGEITFGDGLRGRIPVAGAEFLVSRYRYGGGQIGNVGAGTISKIKGRLNGVKATTNVRAASGGSDPESLEAVKLRAPHELRHGHRAVSANDFSDLALNTPGVPLHRALAIPRKALHNGQLVQRDGAVTLILLPKNNQDKPQPSESQLRAVCSWLEPHRLITTELHLTGPTYAQVNYLGLNILVGKTFDLSAVSELVYQAFLTFLHPIQGGSDHLGWEFGAAIYHADLYQQVLAIPGVERASALSLEVQGGRCDASADVTTIPEGALPALTRDRIHLVIGYA